MKEHTKIYLNFYGYQIPEDCSCEICGSPTVDVHHIDPRQMGGDPTGSKDKIENLMGTCRQHHDEYGDIPELKPMLTLIHLKYMKYNGLKSKIIMLTPPLDEQIRIAEVAAQHLLKNK